MNSERGTINSFHGTVNKMHGLIKKVCDHTHKGSQELGILPRSNVERHFGRLFNAEPSQPELGDLVDLARNHMTDDLDPDGDSDVPAGIAFLGQFIDHDLTLDTMTRLGENAGDPMKIENFRTPRLELDSVYSHGPEAAPFFYDAGENKFKLILGNAHHPMVIGNALDLQRNRNGRAIIGDPRNDENLIVSQLHGREFIKLHNDTIDLITQGRVADIDDFDRAKEFLRGIYQHRILTEFLPAVVDPEVLKPLLDGFNQGKLPRDPIDWDHAPDMPVEFSSAAFRFGHAMIRETYDLNAGAQNVRLFDMGGFDEVPEDKNIDFDLFFDRSGSGFQKARKINTKLTPALMNLPSRIVGSVPNLAERNLIRGQLTFHLPFGEDIADQFFPGLKIPTHPSIKAVGLQNKTPLWFYVLAEAEEYNGKLGPVGGTIVAGTILNLMIRGRQSIANNPTRTLLLSKLGVKASTKGIRKVLIKATAEQ